MKGLSSFYDSSMTRSEMKSVKGGTTWNCKCIGSVGSWTGNYGGPNKGQLHAGLAITKYCSSGNGVCQPSKQ